MKNLSNKKIANDYVKKYTKKKISKELALRIYTTHLLGSDKKLVLHEGGNTSECGKHYIRVNGVNANRIQSGLLIKEVITQRSKARGMKEVDYLKNNLLNKEVTTLDVAEYFYVQFCLDKTTANIITVDGGNIEASLT